MLNPSSNPPAYLDKIQTADQIREVMSRFPIVVDLLKTLDDSLIPQPGDADIKHGCERALTTMLSELSRIEPVTSPTADGADLHAWLQDERLPKLIDADLLERFQHFLDRILHPRTSHP